MFFGSFWDNSEFWQALFLTVFHLDFRTLRARLWAVEGQVCYAGGTQGTVRWARAIQYRPDPCTLGAGISSIPTTRETRRAIAAAPLRLCAGGNRWRGNSRFKRLQRGRRWLAHPPDSATCGRIAGGAHAGGKSSFRGAPRKPCAWRGSGHPSPPIPPA